MAGSWLDCPSLGGDRPPEHKGDRTVKIEELLGEDEPAILEDAARTTALLSRYRRDGEEATRRRVEALYRQVARAVRARDLDELLAHAARIARERFEAGFELAEVEAAFATLEDAIERRALTRMPAAGARLGTRARRDGPRSREDRARSHVRVPRARRAPRRGGPDLRVPPLRDARRPRGRGARVPGLTGAFASLAPRPARARGARRPSARGEVAGSWDVRRLAHDAAVAWRG